MVGVSFEDKPDTSWPVAWICAGGNLAVEKRRAERGLILAG
jgi:hypothetical protein